MAILIRYAPSSLTRAQYDKVNEILQENGPEGPPEALQLHVMFGEEPDLRVSEIWESENAWQQAWDGGLKAALSAAGIELPEPERFPVHEVWVATSANERLTRKRSPLVAVFVARRGLLPLRWRWQDARGSTRRRALRRRCGAEWCRPGACWRRIAGSRGTMLVAIQRQRSSKPVILGHTCACRACGIPRVSE
jgi:hypothetical protein